MEGSGPTGPDRRQMDNESQVEPGVRRRVSIRTFSSAPDAPRARRPTDALLLALAVLGIAALSFPAPGPTTLDEAAADLVKELPGLVGWLWEVSYDLLVGWSLLLLLVALFAPGRKRLFLQELLAVALALGFAVLAGRIGGTDLSTSLEAILRSGSPPIYLAVRVALATAVIVTASPHMARPFRRIGRWLIGVGALASVALGTALPIGIIAGFLTGFVAAALTHLLLGSPGGRLTVGQISEALADLGVDAADVREAALQPRGVALALATTPEGQPLLVKIFGRDAWDGQLVAAAWTSLWHRGAGRSVGSGRLQQVEHEAFVTLLAQRGDVPVAPVVAAGAADEGDALLVLEADGRPFSSLAPGEVDDALLRGYWQILAKLHGLGVAHGHLDGDRLIVHPDGSPGLTDFGAAKIAADRNTLLIDRAQLLVATALSVGVDRALAAAVDAGGEEDVAQMLPFLQPAVFEHATRQAIRDQGWDLKDLRKSIAERTGSEIPPLEQVRRVTWRSVAKLAVIAFLAYGLISALADVGIDTLIDEFQQADKTWFWVALILTPFVQVPQALSTIGATLRPIQFGPVLMLQYGVQFIALAIPSSAARVALEVRFFERVGVPGAGAISIGALDSLSTFVLQMLLIVIIMASGLSSLDLSTSDQGSSDTSGGGSFNWQALLIAVALVGVALIIGLMVPKTRAWLHRVRETLRQKKEDARDALRVLRHPTKVLLLFGGNLVAQVLLAIILGLCLKAFDQSASLASLILVNTFVSLFAGFMPVPGGVGVAEAGYTAGLIAIGIPDSAATSTALLFRLVTFYLPPLWGVFAMRWMQRHSYV